MYKIYVENIPVIITKNNTFLTGEPVTIFPNFSENKLSNNLFFNVLYFIRVQPEIKCLLIETNNASKTFDFFSASLIKINAAGGLVKNTSNSYLYINRLGFWDLPKGKAEINESIDQTAIREVEEECGVSGLEIINALPSTLHTYLRNDKWYLKTSYWYLMQSDFEGELVPQAEEGITECKWLTELEAKSLTHLMYPSIAELTNVYFKLFLST